MEVYRMWFSLEDLVTRGKEASSGRNRRKRMSYLCDHSLKFFEGDAACAQLARADPAMENSEEVGLFCFLKPDSFLVTVEIKT